MRKTLYISIALFLLGTGQAQAQKFAYVDIEALVKVMPQKDSIDKGNKEFVEERETALKQMYTIYQRRMKEYTDAQDTLSKEALQSMAIDIKGLEDRINGMQAEVNQQFEDRQMAGDMFMMNLIKKASTKVAKAQGITYVFPKSSLLAFEGGTDLTELVSKELTKGKKPVPPNNNTPKDPKTPGGGN
ncbi:MAG: OmpH family outer membrane protein [Flavobacteriales bacterium]